MINICQRMTFVPSFRFSDKDTKKEHRAKMIMGKVIYVNRQHKQFTVKFDCGGVQMKETFKFVDIGQLIHIVGGETNGR